MSVIGSWAFAAFRTTTSWLYSEVFVLEMRKKLKSLPCGKLWTPPNSSGNICSSIRSEHGSEWASLWNSANTFSLHCLLVSLRGCSAMNHHSSYLPLSMVQRKSACGPVQEPPLHWLRGVQCQCRDFPKSYVVIPLSIATRNLLHNFLLLRSLSVVLWNSGYLSVACCESASGAVNTSLHC